MSTDHVPVNPSNLEGLVVRSCRCSWKCWPLDSVAGWTCIPSRTLPYQNGSKYGIHIVYMYYELTSCWFGGSQILPHHDFFLMLLFFSKNTATWEKTGLHSYTTDVYFMHRPELWNRLSLPIITTGHFDETSGELRLKAWHTRVMVAFLAVCLQQVVVATPEAERTTDLILSAQATLQIANWNLDLEMCPIDLSQEEGNRLYIQGMAVLVWTWHRMCDVFCFCKSQNGIP